MKQKTALILGGGGFIGGHLAKRLKEKGYFVRIADQKSEHEFWEFEDICDEYFHVDLRDKDQVSQVMFSPKQTTIYDVVNSFDEVYQLAADMGGAGFVFTGENDSDIMHNSAMINLNVLEYCVLFGIKRIFYSSSACMYPEYNQLDPENPNCIEDSAYPAAPDSEYGWEKLFSERLFFAYARNKGVDVRVARFHNVYGPQGTWDGGREKAPAAMCRKVAELQLSTAPPHEKNGYIIDMWGDGKQTRSFLYIDDCIDMVLAFMRQKDFQGPVNIGSEEMVTINELAQVAIDFVDKDMAIRHIDGPLGVRGRNSDNTLYKEKMGIEPKINLVEGMTRTFKWINEQVIAQNGEKKDYTQAVG